MFTPARIKREALRAVNRIRAEYGAEPLTKLPRGRKCRAQLCPIARALPADKLPADTFPPYVYVSGSSIVLGNATRHTPVAIRRFVAAFDFGDFPELELPEY